MPDTGLPWEIPYAAPADLVRDWPDLSEDVADAVAAALDAASNIVAIKSALKTDTFSGSIAEGASLEITGLTITHAAADAANKLLFTAYVGGISSDDVAQAIGLYDGSALFGIGDAAGSRPRVGAGGIQRGQTGFQIQESQNLNVAWVYTPGDTSSRTFALHAINNYAGTNVFYVNRSEDDRDLVNFGRMASSLILIEFKD